MLQRCKFLLCLGKTDWMYRCESPLKLLDIVLWVSHAELLWQEYPHPKLKIKSWVVPDLSGVLQTRETHEGGRPHSWGAACSLQNTSCIPICVLTIFPIRCPLGPYSCACQCLDLIPWRLGPLFPDFELQL
jgi:hypothetical protein